MVCFSFIVLVVQVGGCGEEEKNAWIPFSGLTAHHMYGGTKSHIFENRQERI